MEKDKAKKAPSRSSGWTFTLAVKEATRSPREVQKRAQSAVSAFVKGIRAPQTPSLTVATVGLA